MPVFVANKVMKLLIQKEHKIKGAHALILGVTFKENCPDIRNTKVVDIYNELKEFGLKVDICDPWADKEEVFNEYGVKILSKIDEQKKYQAIVVCVAHQEFLSFDYEKYANNNTVIYDVKGFVDRKFVDARL